MKLTETQKINDQIQGFIEYSNKIASLWTQFVTTSSEQTQQIMQSVMKLSEAQIPAQLETLNSLAEYSMDFFQRSLLFSDTIRQRGNQYLKHEAEGQPPVLIFSYNMLMDGRNFKKPVNYALVEIIPPKEIKIDPQKRPYVIVDPRAGHGAGISGFKDESQVGIAIREGHPVYVVIFFPVPEPGQTLPDVTSAHEKFLNEVARRHPQSPKPCIIGNCQGGWAVLTLVAAHPNIAGVTVINGAPLSYWGGEHGKNPMRYIGGILGGSWVAQFAGDLGNGKFDGANLVMNFEMANPQVTYWQKYYDLFAKIDKEERRFLDFERWWGGYSLLNVNEMRGIIDNLFIGNKLVHGKIPLGESGANLDLRNIDVPIIIFCSAGDQITPPQQALNWIADLYSNTLEIKLEGQVIVYLIHEKVGHLGIFVSSEIAKKEHKHIIDLLNYIEHLTPGLYELKLTEVKKTAKEPAHYLAYIEERSIDDIREKQKNDMAIFNLVRMVSEYNVMGYDFFIGPTVRTLSNEYTAEILRKLHPMRLNQYLLSDLNPFLAPLKWLAPWVRENRVKITENNPFLLQQSRFADLISTLGDSFINHRDSLAEILFYSIYEYIHLLAPFDPQRDMIVHVADRYDEKMTQFITEESTTGGAPEAMMRILLLLVKSQGAMAATDYPQLGKALKNNPVLSHLSSEQLKHLARTQTVIIEHDPELALTALPNLLKTKKETTIILDSIDNMIKSIIIRPSKKLKSKLNQIKTRLLNQD